MTAYVRLLNNGPAAATICGPCALQQDHNRTEDAQDAARTHNRTTHAYPEQTLGIDFEEQA